MRIFTGSTSLRVLLLAATVTGLPRVVHADDGVRWQDVIGIVQAGNVVGAGTVHVTGGGQPWSTLGGHARVDLVTGELGFRVQGLVFAGGPNIGTPGPVTQVKGTVVCNANGSGGDGNAVLIDTPTVPLDATGDAEFEGSLSLPSACRDLPSIAFLIRTPAGAWIANGAVRR
jgi:hypothetical protein